MYSINSLLNPPALGDDTDIPFTAAIMQLGFLATNVPEPVKSMVSQVDWEWCREMASRIARQYRRLNVGEGQWVRSFASRPMMLDKSTPLTHLAGAHAWLMAIAQQAGMEIRDAELEVQGKAGIYPGVLEIAGVASLANAQDPRGTGRRLNAVLSALAADLVVRCHASHPEACIQFVHRKALQIKSPVEGNGAVPLAAYVIRFTGLAANEVSTALVESLEAVTEALGHEMRESVLVLNPAAR